VVVYKIDHDRQIDFPVAQRKFLVIIFKNHDILRRIKEGGMVATTKKQPLTVEGSGHDWFSYTSSSVTMRLWPRVIESADDLPTAFVGAVAPDRAQFPYTVFIPENVVFSQGRAVRTRQKLLTLLPDRLVVLENIRSAIERREHRLDEILYLKVEDVLLSGIITVNSTAGSSRIGFNTVRDNLFAPIIAALRGRFNRGAALAPRPADEARNIIEAVPGISFKFVNYALKSLFPGQAVGDILFKDSANVKTSRRGLLRLIDHYTAPALLMHCGGELIVIEEPAKVRARKKMEFGGIFTFIPREKIEGVVVAEAAPVELVIRLAGGETVQLPLPDAAGLDLFI
jgi:hypothetical protein